MDERVKGEYRRIYTELLMIIMIFSAVSLVVKFNFFDMGLKESLTEFVILIFSPLYLSARQYMMGLNPEETVSKKRQRISFLFAVCFATAGFFVSVFIKRGRVSGDSVTQILIFIAMFTFVYYIGRKLSGYFANKKNKEYED